MNFQFLYLIICITTNKDVVRYKICRGHIGLKGVVSVVVYFPMYVAHQCVVTHWTLASDYYDSETSGAARSITDVALRL